MKQRQIFRRANIWELCTKFVLLLSIMCTWTGLVCKHAFEIIQLCTLTQKFVKFGCGRKWPQNPKNFRRGRRTHNTISLAKALHVTIMHHSPASCIMQVRHKAILEGFVHSQYVLDDWSESCHLFGSICQGYQRKKKFVPACFWPFIAPYSL